MRSRYAACLIVGVAGCGLELAGELPIGPDGSGPGTNDAASPDDASAIDGNTSSSSSGGAEDGATDSGIDAPATGSHVALNVASAINVNLSSDGTIDWVHWGYGGATGPVRKKDVQPSISTFTFTGANVQTGSFENTGWPIRMSWSDGVSPGSHSSSGWYVYFTNSPDAAVTITAPASTTLRTFSLYAGVGEVNARVEASLDDNSANAFSDFDNSAGAAKHISVVYRATSASVKLVVRYRILSRKNTSSNAAINLAAATLR